LQLVHRSRLCGYGEPLVRSRAKGSGVESPLGKAAPPESALDDSRSNWRLLVPFKAKLCIVVMQAERQNLTATTSFYSRLFGIEFSRTLTDLVKVMYAPISIDGTMFSVEWRELYPGEERVAYPVFAVDDLDVAEQELTELGGQVLGERFSLPIDDRVMPEHRRAMLEMGRHESQISDKIGVMRRMTDPNGNMITLFKPESDSDFWFKTGTYRLGLTAEQLELWEKELELARSIELEAV